MNAAFPATGFSSPSPRVDSSLLQEGHDPLRPCFLGSTGSNLPPGCQLVTYPATALAATEYGDPR